VPFVKEGVSYVAGSLKGVSASRRSVARRFLALYHSLEDVHDAYRGAVVDHCDDTVELYDKRLKVFCDRIEDLRELLGIYDETLRGVLVCY
jgi:hypothetical protein